MSDTPRTDKEVWNENFSKMAELAAQLERELNAANAKIAELESRLENLPDPDATPFPDFDPYDPA